MNEIEVINGALGLLKAPRIQSLHDSTEAATQCRLQYALCRDVVLEAGTGWNFASVRAALAASTTTPAMDWAYQYPLPTTPWCIKVRDPNPVLTPWEVGYDPLEGRVLLSDASTMIIRYTARVEDLNIWSPLAVMALQHLLASQLAVPITGQIEKAQAWQKSYATLLTEANVSDGREGSPVQVRPTTILTGRR